MTRDFIHSCDAELKKLNIIFIKIIAELSAVDLATVGVQNNWQLSVSICKILTPGGLGVNTEP